MTKLIIIQAALLVFQIITYFGCERFQTRMHNVLSKFDQHIPFLPFTVIPYSTWFPLIAVFPITLFYGDASLYSIYMTAMFFDIVLSVIIYLIYPTTFERPTPPDTIMGKLMKAIYKGSYKGVNCAPSLHCSSCFMTIYFAIACSGMPMVLRAIYVVVAILIILSTMTTKQHAIIDVITALPMAVVSILIGMALPAEFLLSYVGTI